MKKPIIETLKEKNVLKVSSLMFEAGYSLEEVEEFYQALSDVSEQIEEIRPIGEMKNNWPYSDEIMIKLK